MEERRLLIAVALSLLVLTAYQMLFPAKPVAPGARPAASASAAVPASALPAPPLPPPAAVASAAPTAPVAAPVADEKERRVELEAPTFALVFTNKGARLLSWQL